MKRETKERLFAINSKTLIIHSILF
jgi:hypothetical protein